MGSVSGVYTDVSYQIWGKYNIDINGSNYREDFYTFVVTTSVEKLRKLTPYRDSQMKENSMQITLNPEPGYCHPNPEGVITVGKDGHCSSANTKSIMRMGIIGFICFLVCTRSIASPLSTSTIISEIAGYAEYCSVELF